jgi:carbon monoxide dehydrogenase subunit G
MGLLIENRFDVAAAPEEVYRLMLDVERVAPCIPGAEVTGRNEDGSYDARVTVKLGPVSMSYRGTVAIDAHDDSARTAALRAKASEARGQGTAQATMAMAVEPAEAGGGSRVSVSTDMLVTGRVAQMGKGIMQDVATRMIGQMARNMEALLDGDPGTTVDAKPVGGVGLAAGVLADRVRRIGGGRDPE